MAEEKKQVVIAPRKNVEVKLDVDPNDPRRNVAATPNLSDLNAEDPEVEPQFQNPVE